MSNLDKIVNINIELQAVVSSGVSFDNILIVGPAPAAPGEVAPADVGVYSSLAAVNEAGWVSEGDAADPVGIAARIAFSQPVKPTRIYIAVQKATEEEGVLEEPTLSLSRAEAAETGWYMALPAGIEEANLESMAEWTEAREKMFGYAYKDPTKNPVAETYFRTFGICYGSDTGSGDPYKHVAMAVRFLAFPTGSETWVNKPLAAVSISKFTDTDINTIEKDPASYYIRVGDTGLVQGGKVRAGEWIDVIRFRDWLKNDMQLRILNLKVKRPKVPYTDKGIGLVHNQMIKSLKEGRRRGGIAEDQYNSDGELIPGFITSVPLAADLSDEQRKSRVLEDCKFSALLAGAIHVTKVNGFLGYSH